MIDPVSIVLISGASLLALILVAAVPVLLLFGVAVSIIKFLAPVLLTLALGFGIGFGIAKMTKEKAPVQAPVEIHIEAAQESAPQMVAIPVKVQK